MSVRKRKSLFWIFKCAGILISCALPIWAICEKFPLWADTHGTERTVGVGIILIAVVLIMVFRRTVFDFAKDHFDLKHAPPLTVWLVMIVLSYILIYLADVMRDIATVSWMGFIGCVLGNVCTSISNRFKKG